MSCISKWRNSDKTGVRTYRVNEVELQDMDPDSEDGKEIGSTLEVLDKLCAQ